MLDQFTRGDNPAAGVGAPGVYTPFAQTVSAGRNARFVSSEGRIPFVTNSNEQNAGHAAQVEIKCPVTIAALPAFQRTERGACGNCHRMFSVFCMVLCDEGG